MPGCIMVDLRCRNPDSVFGDHAADGSRLGASELSRFPACLYKGPESPNGLALEMTNSLRNLASIADLFFEESET